MVTCGLLLSYVSLGGTVVLMSAAIMAMRASFAVTLRKRNLYISVRARVIEGLGGCLVVVCGSGGQGVALRSAWGMRNSGTSAVGRGVV